MLDTLKKSGNPYYQFYDDYQTYQEKCKTEDPSGHNLIFKLDDDTNDELLENLDQAKYCNLDDKVTELPQAENDSDDDEDQEEKDESRYITKDAVNFDYNKSLCLSNKFPEISNNSDSSIPIRTVAPGEGKIPTNIMREKDWDI